MRQRLRITVRLRCDRKRTTKREREREREPLYDGGRGAANTEIIPMIASDVTVLDALKRS